MEGPEKGKYVGWLNQEEGSHSSLERVSITCWRKNLVNFVKMSS